MSIKALEKAVKQYKTKAEVARRLGITPQRLNNWFKTQSVPEGWAWNLLERLKK
jgi:DNA-binding transcriptional regulator YiaG